MIRKFHLWRDRDETGVSGTGKIAEGCLFSNGWVSLAFLTQVSSLAFYFCIEDVEAIHGHKGSTRVVFEDAK